uniref:Flavin-containing monooxygenase n=1 Tax=Hydra vulgaris TaxID=6087 RepID=T2MF32_HYDVU
MGENRKSVCVVGAGLSGLAAAKCMLDAGFKVICYDENESVGGKWNKDNNDYIPRSIITNVPKTSMCFSDFPPNNYPLFMSAENFYKYLNSYSDHFNLQSVIKFGCSVLKVEPEEALLADTKWKVTIKPKCCPSEVKLFDIVLVCSGFYKKPYIPKKIKQVLSEFKGEIIHSRNFKDSSQYKNKRIIVYGLGNTGGDIACDLSNINETTHVSTYRGTVVVPRVLKDGSIFLNKSKLRLLDYIPNFIQRFFFKYLLKKMLSHIYNQDVLGLSSSILSSVCINDLLCMQILFGKVVIKPEILKTNGRTVFFSNNTFLKDVDTIVLCTGYKRQFSFLSDKVVNIKHNGKFIPLYKNIFYPKFYKSMAFIGMASLNGPYTLMAEMQARYAAQVFKGIIKLPDENKMNADIDKQFQYLKHHYSDLKEINFIPGSAWLYFEDLAKGIGCNISLVAIFFKDPKLAWHLFMYRSIFEYRLFGPNSWAGAREAVLNESSCIYDYLKGSRNVCEI